MIYYTSDLHFGHQNVIKFDNRPFDDIDEMDRTIIECWNSKVTNADTVYIIGDFAFKNEKPEEWYLEQLKGKLHLIIGNHDGKLLENPIAMARFESVEKMKHVVDGNKQISLCHFPLAEWNGFYKGRYHIFGHIHIRTNMAYQYMSQFPNALNAGCMINDFTPVTFDELVCNNMKFRENVANASNRTTD